jgi:hypothetical protein
MCERLCQADSAAIFECHVTTSGAGGSAIGENITNPYIFTITTYLHSSATGTNLTMISKA